MSQAIYQNRPNLAVQLSATACLACLLCGNTHAKIFNTGWLFTRGDPSGAEQIEHPDQSWEKVRLPHDWAIAGPFDRHADGYAGKLPWRGVGWYRKYWKLPATDPQSRVYLDFDGVMAFPKVYVNGKLAGTWDYGYTPFRVDLTPHVRFGEENVIAVRVDTRNQGTRWYPGAGIYRNVALTVKPPVHLAHHGTFVTTPSISEGDAQVVVRNTVEDHLQNDQDFALEVTIVDPAGNVLFSDVQESSTSKQSELQHAFEVRNPQRWDIEHPALYTAVTSLIVEGKTVDERETTFGIREFRFTADDGFHLNGRRVQLQGVNLHHDLGPLGAAFNKRAMERQLEIMQDMGVNALRTSHNPPAAEVLDLCDRMGIVVWDELFDKWDDKAARIDGKPSFEDHARRHVRSLVLRDRNHPSVVTWSIGNEISNQPHDPEGKSRERVQLIRSYFRELDPSRPISLGCHIPSTASTDILSDLDLTGWNYQRRYGLFRERFPEIPIVYSESASTFSTRGFYELPLPTTKIEYSSTHQASSYDLTSAAWADIPEVELELMRRDDFVAGEFVWTGFDYLGEPTPFSRQARSSYFGIVDLCGIPKDRFYLYRSQWNTQRPTLHLLPHWNWEGRQGTPIPVFLYTNGDSAELFVNGISQGIRTKGDLPPRPENLALGASAEASSQADNHAAASAIQENGNGWLASKGDDQAWWQVDLGKLVPVRCLSLEFRRESKLYGYRVLVSEDGNSWEEILAHRASRRPRWGGIPEAIFRTDTVARHLRIEFDKSLDNARPGLASVGVFSAWAESDYYCSTYDYRLRWNEVPYEPGELKAVVRKDGEILGQCIVRTAAAPHSIRLTPDRVQLDSSGEDLCYVTVEAIDRDGVTCPLAENEIRFAVEGPAEIAGVGNGNPLSLEPFQASKRKLFYGKAMLIVRAEAGTGGEIRIVADSPDLASATATIQAGKITELSSSKVRSEQRVD